MPTKQQRARLKRLSRELQFDHPGVHTRLDSPSSRRDRRRAPRQNAEQHVYEAQPFFILSDDTHRLMLAELRGGAAHVYSYLEDPRTTPQGKNVLDIQGPHTRDLYLRRCFNLLPEVDAAATVRNIRTRASDSDDLDLQRAWLRLPKHKRSVRMRHAQAATPPTVSWWAQRRRPFSSPTKAAFGTAERGAKARRPKVDPELFLSLFAKNTPSRISFSHKLLLQGQCLLQLLLLLSFMLSFFFLTPHCIQGQVMAPGKHHRSDTFGGHQPGEGKPRAKTPGRGGPRPTALASYTSRTRPGC
jgi:hypothetical protein